MKEITKIIMINIKSFIFENGEKIVTLKAYIYSVYYRFLIKVIPMKTLEPRLGKRGKESAAEESIEHLRIAKLYAFHVNRVTEHMPWEAKCLTRSLTIARLLREKGIDSTIYLGVAKDEGGLQAHSWIRCGKMYLTDPMMDKFTVLETFKYM